LLLNIMDKPQSMSVKTIFIKALYFSNPTKYYVNSTVYIFLGQSAGVQATGRCPLGDLLYELTRTKPVVFTVSGNDQERVMQATLSRRNLLFGPSAAVWASLPARRAVLRRNPCGVFHCFSALRVRLIPSRLLVALATHPAPPTTFLG
jgi:hypothetical protein